MLDTLFLTVVVAFLTATMTYVEVAVAVDVAAVALVNVLVGAESVAADVVVAMPSPTALLRL